METIMSWQEREYIEQLDKQLASLGEEYEWLKREYERTADEYDKAVEMVCFVWNELHSILPHFAERLADENPTLKEMVE